MDDDVRARRRNSIGQRGGVEDIENGWFNARAPQRIGFAARAVGRWVRRCRGSLAIALQCDLKSGGMHLIVQWSHGAADVQLAKLAQAAGLAVEPLSARAVTRPCEEALLLGFTNVAEADATELCQRLERAIGRQLSARIDSARSKSGVAPAS